MVQKRENMTKDAGTRRKVRTNHAVLARFASIRRHSLVRISSTILKLTLMGASPVPTIYEAGNWMILGARYTGKMKAAGA